jgi:hypothetical protein
MPASLQLGTPLQKTTQVIFLIVHRSFNQSEVFGATGAARYHFNLPKESAHCRQHHRALFPAAARKNSPASESEACRTSSSCPRSVAPERFIPGA